MKLAYLTKGKFSVLAEVLQDQNGREYIGILEEFKNAEGKYRKSINGFAALFDIFKINGRGSIPRNCFHKPDSNDDLYQFIKGDLRLLCFFNEEGDAVILSHYEIKKGRKLPEKALNKARNLRNRYKSDFSKGLIKFREI